MQNAGWLFSMWPLLRRLYPDPARRAARAREHLDFFNTHPYMMGTILGVVSTLEEQAAGDPSRAAQVLAVKKSMAGPLSALGEGFFWSTLRPLLALVALYLGVGTGRIGPAVAALVFLVPLNAAQFFARVWGFQVGRADPLGVVQRVGRIPLQRWMTRGAWVCLGLSGVGLLLATETMVKSAGRPMAGVGALLVSVGVQRFGVPRWVGVLALAGWCVGVTGR
jgi:PTS system mannose-specific IID component